jgi:hypothetical protein
VGPGEGEAAGFGALYGTASVEQDTVDLVAGYHRVRDGIVQSASSENFIFRSSRWHHLHDETLRRAWHRNGHLDALF